MNFATTVDPLNGRSSQALGQFFTVMLTLLFLSVDGHLVLVETIVKSYEAPPGQAWMAPAQFKAIALFGGYAFLAGLLLALRCRRFLLLSLNLVMGMMSRAAPSLNLFSVGMPAALTIGVITIAVASRRWATICSSSFAKASPPPKRW